MKEEGFQYSTNALSVILKDVMIGTIVAWWRKGEVWKWRLLNYWTMNYVGANSRISTMLWYFEHSNNNYILSIKTIRIWYIFFWVSKPDTLIMGSKLSCCFRVKKPPPAAEQELEALRDIQREVDVDCTTAINFPPSNSHWKYVSHAWLEPWSSIYISAKVLFVKNLPQQVSRRQPAPPLVVVRPPPSPRLPNVHGEEELDFRNSSTLCLWSWDPRESGHKEWYPCWGERCP